jgi:hypothetical protein
VIVGEVATLGVDWRVVVGDGFKIASWLDEPQAASKKIKNSSANERRSLLLTDIENVPQH